MSCAEWMPTPPDGFWGPNGISWVLPQLYELPRISRPDSRPDNLKFKKTQASVASPGVFENVSESVDRGTREGEISQAPPPPVLTNKGGNQESDHFRYSRRSPSADSSSAYPRWASRWAIGWRGSPGNGWEETASHGGLPRCDGYLRP